MLPVVLAFVVGALVVVLFWLVVIATPHDPELVRLDLALPGCPDDLDGARIFFFGDLHLGPSCFNGVWLRERLRAQDVDMLVITGDLVDDARGVPAALAFLRDLPVPRLGIWFVPGNNENREIDVEPFLDALGDRGVRVLRNEHVAMGGGSWCVAGVDDPARNRDDLLRALPPRPRPFTVLLAHSPEIMFQARRHGVDLVFAGHTHGGQVRLPFVGALWTDTDRTGLRYQYGLYRDGNTTLVLTKGLGCSKLPIRLLARPEAVLLRLSRGDDPKPRSASSRRGGWPPAR